MRWRRPRHPEPHLRQPCVRGNDWTVLSVPEIGDWEPELSVSVVIPAHNPRHLHHVLAALAAQTYPAHLLEVLVVDDGSDPPVEPGEVRPENTRVVAVPTGWGRAAACQAGADASDGDVIHWLDADMVAGRHEVEAQMRWHHLIDYAVVLGHKVFVDLEALDDVGPQQLRDALIAGEDPDALAAGQPAPHAWVEDILEQTNELSTAGPRAMRAHVGASASVGRDLFVAAGGMPTDLVLGEDVVLGYRLREAGAVFIPDREARNLHLGETSVMRNQDGVNRYNKPFITDLVPEFRGHRLATPRSYAVPYVEVVLDVTGESYESVRLAVDTVLSGSVPDVVVSLTGPWPSLAEDRRSVLDDPLLDLRLIRASYATDARVRWVEAVASRCEATFRVTLPHAEAFPAGAALERLLTTMEKQHEDRVTVLLEDGGRATFRRTASVERERRVVAAADSDSQAAAPDIGVVSRSMSWEDAGFVRRGDAKRPRTLKGIVPWRPRT